MSDEGDVKLDDVTLAIVDGAYVVNGRPVEADEFRRALVDIEHEVFEHVAHQRLREADRPCP